MCIRDRPTAAPTSTAIDMCEGDLLTLTANATDAVSYTWTGPNGFTSTAVNPEITDVSVANNGTYTLTIIGEGNCATTESILVNNIQITPTIPTVTTNGPVCEVDVIVLSIQEQYVGTTVNYEWTNGGGTVIGNTRMMTILPTDANAISPYRVSVTVDGCTSPLACLLYTSPSPRDLSTSRMPSSA